MTEERISEFEDMTVETSKAMRKKSEINRTEICKKGETTTRVLTYTEGEHQGKKGRKEQSQHLKQ